MVTVPKYITVAALIIGAAIGTVTIFGYIVDSQIEDEIIELELLESMNCTEIMKYNYMTKEYASKDNRQYARQQVLECADDEEYLAYFGLCDQLFDKKRGGEPYQLEDHQKRADIRLKECGDEFWREDFDIDFEIDYTEKFD